MKKLIILLFLLPLFSLAQDIPDKPTTYITDEANVINDDDEKALNHKLRLFKDSTSNQICVYVTDSLKGRDLSTLCQQIFDKWDIGQKDKDNGVLIAVFVSDHKFRIHTGYGLEGALPDVLTKRIQDEDMRPSFKQNNYYEGINKGVDQLIYYSKNEYRPDASDASDGASTQSYIIAYAITLALYILNFFLIRFVYKEQKVVKTVLWSITGLLCLIPFAGIGFMILTLIIAGIGSLMRLARRSGGSYSGSGSSNADYSWSSSSSYSSSSDSDYSSSSSSDDSYSGGGGDSGGGGSNSDW